MQRELRYPKWYHHELYERIAQKIKTSESFAFVGLPGAGTTTAMRVLAFNKEIQKAHFPKEDVLFVYIDVHGLGGLREIDFYRLFRDEFTATLGEGLVGNTDTIDHYAMVREIRSLLVNALQKYDKVVILCNRISALSEIVPAVVQQIRALRDSAKDRFLFVPILERPGQLDSFDKDNLLQPMLGSPLYMGLLSDTEMEQTLHLYEQFYSLEPSPRAIKRITPLVGGHASISISMLRLLHANPEAIDVSESELVEVPEVVRELKRVWGYLDEEQQKIISIITRGDEVNPSKSLDKLKELGLVDNLLQIRIPLFTNYVNKLNAEIAAVSVRIEGGRIFLGSQEVRGLSLVEYKILEHLYQKKDNLVSRDELATLIAPESAGAGVSNESIDQYISRLRRKIGESGGDAKMVKTVFGRGYMWED